MILIIILLGIIAVSLILILLEIKKIFEKLDNDSRIEFNGNEIKKNVYINSLFQSFDKGIWAIKKSNDEVIELLKNKK